MAITAICGFETGALLAEHLGTIAGSSTSGSVAIESTTVRTGTYSVKVTPASGAQGWWGTTSGLVGFVRFYIRVTTRPATTARIIFGTSSGVNLRLNPDGTIAYYEATTLKGTSTTALTDTTKWYRIEARELDGTTVTVLQIDGTVEVTDSPSGWTFIGKFGATDTVADTYTAYYDDIAVDGAAFPGEGQALILLPASINAAGGWVEGDGAGTAGIAAALATRPPPGVASASETSATNAESPTNSATDDLDLNLDSYTTAGVTGTVNAVRAIVRHGEDIATSTKAGAVSIVSNPAQGSEDAFNYGNDGGAHGAEVTPGLWATAVGAIQSAPSVVLATQPVLRIGKRTATTRVVCVDFAGLYVDYTPAVVDDRVPYVNRMPQLLAH